MKSKGKGKKIIQPLGNNTGIITRNSPFFITSAYIMSFADLCSFLMQPIIVGHINKMDESPSNSYWFIERVYLDSKQMLSISGGTLSFTNKQWPHKNVNKLSCLLAALLHRMDIQESVCGNVEKMFVTVDVLNKLLVVFKENRGKFLEKIKDEHSIKAWNKMFDYYIGKWNDVIKSTIKQIMIIPYIVTGNRIYKELPSGFNIARDAVRLESLGRSGIYRQFVVTEYFESAFFDTIKTKKCRTMKELDEYTTSITINRRFPITSKALETMIDYLYDVSIHLNSITLLPKMLPTFKKRMKHIHEFLIYYGVFGKLNYDYLTVAEGKYLKHMKQSMVPIPVPQKHKTAVVTPSVTVNNNNVSNSSTTENHIV